MDADSSSITFALAATAGVTAAIFAYLRRLKRERYLNFWAAGWCILALHYLATSLRSEFGAGDLLWFAENLLLAAAALTFLSGVA